MRKHNFLSLFLIFSLLISLFLPVSASAAEDFDIQAKGAVLVEASTGEILYEKSCHQEMYPASITKVMTALLVLEAIDSGTISLADSVSASSSAYETLSADGSTANIKVGEVLSVEQLLNCMLIVSANEACNILAEHVCGDVASFVDKMNERAQELGCKNTHFVNATGLHDSQHYTSAYDIYLIVRECMTHELFMKICNSKSAEIPATNLSDKRTLHSTNALISNWRRTGYLYRDAQGIKTGSTPEAGQCLVSSAVRGSRKLISVVLGAEQLTLEDGSTKVMSFSETARLFEHGFNDFSRRQIISDAEPICEVPVSLSSETNYVVVHPAETLEYMLPNDLPIDQLERDITLVDSAEAPIAAGDELGEMTLSYRGKVYATVPLLALSDVSASWLLVARRNIARFFARPLVRIIAAAVVLAVVAFFVLRGIGRPSRRRYGRSRVSSRSSYRGRRR